MSHDYVRVVVQPSGTARVSSEAGPGVGNQAQDRTPDHPGQVPAAILAGQIGHHRDYGAARETRLRGPL
ncbi:MAG: hypothetical protein ACRDP4_12425, partial [Nocardioidaceae bacterium]